MLRDHDIQQLAGQLLTVGQENRRHHDNLSNLLDNFNSLLESYNLLKSDYEEEKEAREKYKKMARGQERNPFVLVLVDGDGYPFHEDLIRSRNDGGITAARRMTDSIKELLHDRLGDQAEQCRIMIRIYANVLGLSKALARAGLVGHEARSFAGFAASFTRSQDLADFIDAGDKKEGADHKIREMFRLFADINQCKHIFFAGCHDVGYLSFLMPYRGMADRITLLKGPSFHPEFRSLGLSISEIPYVFMSSPLGTSPEPITSKSAVPKSAVCWFFQKGICKYGNECTKQHITPQQHEISKPQDDKSNTQSIVREMKHYAKMPQSPSSKDGEPLIHVNKNGERIDTAISQPTNEEWNAYARRAKQHKLCNQYHLGGECSNLNCQFDHSNVDDSLIEVMRYIMRQHVCPSGPDCRLSKCYLGHMCQKPGCTGGKPCRFNQHAHTLDRQVWGTSTPTDTRSYDSNSSEADSFSA